MSKLWAATAAAACLWAGQASAVTTFNDRMVFASHGQGTTAFLTLDNLGETRPTPFSIGPLEITGATPTSAYYFSGPQAGHPGSYGDVNGSAWLQMRLDWSNWVTWTSASSFQLIGFDLRPYFDSTGLDDAGETIFYETDTGENGAFTLPDSNTSVFLGLMFNAPVHSVTFSSGHDFDNAASWFGVDNVHIFQSATAVPEPASLALLIGGLGIVGVAARRRNAA